MGQTLLQLLRVTKEDSSRTCIDHALPELEAFLSGVFDGLDNCGFPLADKNQERFDLWLARQHSLSVGRSLFQNLTLLSGSDSHGFDLFFAKLEEFLSSQVGASMWTTELTQPSGKDVPKIRDLGPVLKCLRDGPEPLLRARSVTLLAAYLNGHVQGCRALHSDIKCSPDLDGFAVWLRNQHAKQRDWLGFKWHRIVKYLSDPHENEARAFDAFFPLFDRWLAEGGVSPKGE